MFTQLNYMEKRGSGLRKIKNLTEELKTYSPSNEPYFESDPSSFFTIIPNVNYGLSDEDFAAIINRESTPKTENTTPKGQNPTLKKIGEKAQAVIDILIEDPFIKREELAERLGLTLEGVKYNLGQLQKKGYVLRDDGRKNGRWRVLIKK